MANPSDPSSNQVASLRFAASHEWVRQEPDGSCTIGISDHAQEALGELVYVELPELGAMLVRGDACAVVESTKAASDVYAPLDGEVIAVNEALADTPQTVNEHAFSDGWLFKLKPTDAAQIDELLSAQAYTSGLDA